ncbi:uncharacterized protein LOC134853389 [Symsagittifera roscoffensis]|uniref:uncharacterized protein LOC134853389 n=1 Tax=Symsagittifera roscoffensis TaxID=84072 RepID=UPI00307B867D
MNLERPSEDRALEIISLVREKFSIESPQIFISFTTIVMNLYCLLTVLSSKDLRKHEYYLVSLQSFIDFLFGGLLSLAHYSLELINAGRVYCDFMDNPMPNFYQVYNLDSVHDFCQTFNIKPKGDIAKYSGLTRRLIELYPFWAQTILTFGIALGRYILICHGTRAKTLFRQKNRLIYYGILTFTALLIPSMYVMDFSRKAELHEHHCVGRDCWNAEGDYRLYEEFTE